MIRIERVDREKDASTKKREANTISVDLVAMTIHREKRMNIYESLNET